MISRRILRTSVPIWIALLACVGCATIAPRNTPECQAFLLSEADRLEQQFEKTVTESSRRLEAMFEPEHFGGDRERALMTKGAFMVLFNRQLKTGLSEVGSAPLAYREVAQAEEYPKGCDNRDKLRKFNDRLIVMHTELWGKALEAASKFQPH